MSATSWPPRSNANGFTVADLHALPGDGPRYELIDGSLIVSPSATGSHNLIARWIGQDLEDRASVARAHRPAGEVATSGGNTSITRIEVRPG